MCRLTQCVGTAVVETLAPVDMEHVALKKDLTDAKADVPKATIPLVFRQIVEFAAIGLA